jgi:hypothetical protein
MRKWTALGFPGGPYREITAETKKKNNRKEVLLLSGRS